ncbi:MAG: class I SAM-dependent methyltransferase family protein [Candidatus Aenigmarchaeota archaeon]|nr:class I SAM-dependent methyltransferase family protein [Candidatus Aenigmarchaeota archaeon]
MRPLAKFLENQLTKDELEMVPKSYDVMGSEGKGVAIIEIPKKLEDKKHLIAEAVMDVNKNVKSVLNKVSGRKGTFRLDELELVAGDEDTEVLHKEYGYMLKLDPQKVFFSPREATDRDRIASLVKPGETVLVLFSGVAPYPIAIAKKSDAKVYGVDINPAAHEYAKENIRINKLAHRIVVINDDVRNAGRIFDFKFDRIVMPIAVGGEDYLDEAFSMVKDGGVIHFYSFGDEKDLFSKAEGFVKEAANRNNIKFVVEQKNKVLPFGIRSHKICLDIKAGVPKPGLRD